MNNIPNKPKMSIGMILILAVIIILAIATAAMLISSLANGSTPSEETSGPPEPSPSQGTDDIEETVMSINGYNIKKSEYTLSLYKELYNMIAGLKIPENLETESEKLDYIEGYLKTEYKGQLPVDICKETAKLRAAELIVVREECAKKGISLTDEEKLAVDVKYTQMYLFETNDDNPDEFYLNTFGVTKSQFMAYQCEMELARKLALNYTEGFECTDEELEKCYNENKSMFNSKTIQAILVRAVDEENNALTGEQRLMKKDLAESILKQAEDGENFTSLVNNYSDDTTKAQNQGIFMIQDGGTSALAKWANSAKKDSMDIVEDEKSFYIVKCINDGTFESRKEDVKDYYALTQYQKDITERAGTEKYKPSIFEETYNSVKVPDFVTDRDQLKIFVNS